MREDKRKLHNSTMMVCRSLYSNLYKMCRLKFLWIHIGLPLLAVVIFKLYYLTSMKTETEKVELYLQVIALAFPMMIALVTTMVYENDRNAADFQVLRILSGDKASGHIGNLVALLVLGMVASGIAVVGYSVREKFYVNLTMLLFSANIASYLIQYVVCYTFGKGASLWKGVIGTLLAALMYLGIGDSIWYWIPCSYGIRMVSYYLLKQMPVQESKAHIIPYVCEDYQVGARWIMVVTALMVVFFYIWGRSWQGVKQNFD